MQGDFSLFFILRMHAAHTHATAAELRQLQLCTKHGTSQRAFPAMRIPEAIIHMLPFLPEMESFLRAALVLHLILLQLTALMRMIIELIARVIWAKEWSAFVFACHFSRNKFRFVPPSITSCRVLIFVILPHL